MTDERLSQRLRQQAAQEWPSPPDVWPSVRTSIQQRSQTGTGQYGALDVGGDDATAPPPRQPGARTANESGRSLPWELGKMAAGAAVVTLVALVLAAVFSGQQSNLPGFNDDDGDSISGAQVVTDGEVLSTQWNDEQEIHELVAVNARTGEESDAVPRIPLGPSGLIAPKGISADGGLVAAISADETIGNPFAGGSQIWPRASQLTIVDTETGDTLQAPLPDDGWVPMSVFPQFSPDGETLALVYDRAEGSTIMLFDTESADLVAEREIEGHVTFLEFSPDGDDLILYRQDLGSEPGTGQPEPPEVAMVDADNLDEDWRLTLDDITSGVWCAEECDAPVQDRVTESWSPAITLDESGDHLYIAHVDQPVFERVDLGDQSVETIEYEISPDKPDDIEYRLQRGGYAMGDLSNDGDRMYLLLGGADAYTNGFVELNLLEADATLKSSGNVPDAGVPANWIATLPVDSDVLLGGRESLIRYSTGADGSQENLSTGTTVRPARTLDGDLILVTIDDDTAEQPELGVADPESLEVVESWTAEPRTQWANMPGW